MTTDTAAEIQVYRGLFPDWQTAIEVADQLTSPEYRRRAAAWLDPTTLSDRAIVRRHELGAGHGWQVVGVRAA